MTSVIDALSLSHYSRSGTVHYGVSEIPKCRGGWPYRTWKGVLPCVEWVVVLYPNSASANHSDHLLGT
jgi:hypothetical protein